MLTGEFKPAAMLFRLSSYKGRPFSPWGIPRKKTCPPSQCTQINHCCKGCIQGLRSSSGKTHIGLMMTISSTDTHAVYPKNALFEPQTLQLFSLVTKFFTSTLRPRMLLV